MKDTSAVSDVSSMDPNTMIEMQICDRLNAGREPSTRWGRIAFDKEGKATIKVPLKDVTTLHSLGWLSVEDQEKYLGLSQEAVQPTTSQVDELQKSLDASKNACTRLAQKNAELETKLDEIMMKYQTEYTAYSARINEQLDQLGKDLQAANVRAEEASARADALAAENMHLKSHSQATTQMPPVEKHSQATTQMPPVEKQHHDDKEEGKKGKKGH